MTGRQILRVIAWVVGIAVVFFVFLWIGFAVRSSRAYHAAEQAMADGDEILAQGYFERSIRSHCPLNVWGKRAATRLEEMARAYEANGNADRAIDAYEGLMTALAAIDTGWNRSRRETIERLEQKVLSLRKAAAKTDDKS